MAASDVVALILVITGAGMSARGVYIAKKSNYTEINAILWCVCALLPCYTGAAIAMIL